jgi:polyhydroxyalkanoate synthesis repressor PhaR
VTTATETETAKKPVTIKKYANRRLYNTATSSYVTLDDLCHMVKENQDFVVYDAKTGEDITRPVLTQIIVEEESKGQNLLPINFLRQLIAFYGDSLQSLVPRYLDYSMNSFARNQEQMRRYVQSAFDGLFPFGSLEEMSKQNMALMEKALSMFVPFGEAKGQPGEAGKAEPSRGAPAGAEAALADLKQQIDALQKQIESLNAPKKKD